MKKYATNTTLEKFHRKEKNAQQETEFKLNINLSREKI